MIAVVAAGGRGTRMMPATQFVNKHMLPVGPGKLMIDYPLTTVRKNGFQVVTIVTGCEHAGQVSEYVQDGHKYGFQRVNYEVQPKPAGIADVVKRVSHLLQGEGLFLILGDNYFSDAQVETIRNLDKSRAAAFEYDVGSLEKAKSFGQAVMENGRVSKLVEKPKEPTHARILTGMYYFPAGVAKVVRDLTPSQRQELEITSLMNMYRQMDLLDVHQIAGQWRDLGEWTSWQSFVAEQVG